MFARIRCMIAGMKESPTALTEEDIVH